jgi:nitrile hydratase accessory protein
LRPPEPPERFAEPWQAQAFALAVALADAGAFNWTTWTQSFAAAQERAVRAGLADEDAYAEAWVETLETLLQAAGMMDAEELTDRVEAWREAFLHTPHGRPVELAAGRAD